MLQIRELKKGLLRALAIGGALFALPAQAQDSQAADSTAEVVLPATLVNLEGLDFGQLVAGTGGAMTIVPATDAKTAIGGVVIVGATAHRATFRSSLPIGLIMSYLGDASVTLTRQGGTETMTVLLTYSTGTGLGPGPLLNTYVTNATEQYYYAGGTLLVANGQTPGIYDGTFTFTIDNL